MTSTSTSSPPCEPAPAAGVVARGDALPAAGVTRRLLGRFAAVLPEDDAKPDLGELTDYAYDVGLVRPRP